MERPFVEERFGLNCLPERHDVRWPKEMDVGDAENHMEGITIVEGHPHRETDIMTEVDHLLHEEGLLLLGENMDTIHLLEEEEELHLPMKTATMDEEGLRLVEHQLEGLPGQGQEVEASLPSLEVPEMDMEMETSLALPSVDRGPDLCRSLPNHDIDKECTIFERLHSNGSQHHNKN
jgi:hypothetical protein